MGGRGPAPSSRPRSGLSVWVLLVILCPTRPHFQAFVNQHSVLGDGVFIP